MWSRGGARADGSHDEHEEDNEANAVVVAATNVVAKLNATSPSSIKQMNHPTSDMVGKDLGITGGNHLPFSINRGGGAVSKCSRPLWLCISAILGKKKTLKKILKS